MTCNLKLGTLMKMYVRNSRFR